MKDGSVRHHGEACVPHRGERIGTVKPWVFNQLALLARDVQFFDTADGYVSSVTDGTAGHCKIVEDYMAAPPRLQALESAIEGSLDKVTWSK